MEDFLSRLEEFEPDTNVVTKTAGAAQPKVADTKKHHTFFGKGHYRPTSKASF